MTAESVSTLEYSRKEAKPFATALSDLFLSTLSGFEEFEDVTVRGLEISKGQHYAFERRTFSRGDYAYLVTIGEGNTVCEFGISRTEGGKVEPTNFESLVIFIDDAGASVSYTNGSLSSGAVRFINSPEAVASGYHMLNILEASTIPSEL